MKIKLLLVAGALLLCANISAQKSINLTLEQSLEIALNDNPTIKIADLEIQRQEYVKRETTGNLLPTLSASGVYNRAILKSSIDMGGGQKFSFEPDNTITGSLSLSLPIFVPAIYKTMKMNDQQIRAAVEQARGSKITLINEVKKAYYNILLAKRSLQVLKSSQKNIGETVRQTEVMMAQKMASEYDLLTAQVQLSNLTPSIIQIENSIKVAKHMLKMYLSLPADMEFEVVGELDNFEVSAIGFNADSNPDLSGNSSLTQMEIETNIMLHQLKVLRTSYMPTLAAFSSFQVMGRDKISFGAMQGGTGTSSSSFEIQTPLSAGVQLSVPIFAGRTNTFRERQLRTGIEQMRLQKDYAAQGLNVEATNILSSMISARAQMEANAKTVAQAEKGYSIAKTRYYNKLGTILEVNSSELSLTMAKLNYSQSLYDLLAAQADYNAVIGVAQ